MCIRLSVAVLFIIIKDRKESKGALVGALVNKRWHIHAVECYTSSFKRAMWNYFQDIFNEKSQVQIMYILSYFSYKN